MGKQELVTMQPKSSCVQGHNGRLYPALDTPMSQCPTSLDLTTKRGKYLLMAAGNPGDLEFDKNGTLIVTAVDWLIFPEERVDPESGEVSTFARTVLFTADGDTFRTTSAHVPHRIAAACDLFTEEEWKAGIPFLVRERKSKQGRTYHDLRIHPDFLKE